MTKDLTLEDLTLNITSETHVNASLEATFAALLEQLGPYNERGSGEPMPMKLEAWPGGRWYRDLGNDNGHFWGHVGPLFASYPFASNVQYRLSQVDGGTLIKFHHQGFGFVSEEHRGGVVQGWASILDRIRAAAEKR
jgi:hypothetical protein